VHGVAFATGVGTHACMPELHDVNPVVHGLFVGHDTFAGQLLHIPM
jgi:hypothetical protein